MLLCDIAGDLQTKLDRYNNLLEICAKITNTFVDEDIYGRTYDIIVAQRMMEVLLPNNSIIDEYCRYHITDMGREINKIVNDNFITPLLELIPNTDNFKVRWMREKINKDVKIIINNFNSKMVIMESNSKNTRDIIYNINSLCSDIIQHDIIDLKMDIASKIYTHVLQIRERLLQEANSIKITTV